MALIAGAKRRLLPTNGDVSRRKRWYCKIRFGCNGSIVSKAEIFWLDLHLSKSLTFLYGQKHRQRLTTHEASSPRFKQLQTTRHDRLQTKMHELPCWKIDTYTGTTISFPDYHVLPWSDGSAQRTPQWSEASIIYIWCWCLKVATFDARRGRVFSVRFWHYFDFICICRNHWLFYLDKSTGRDSQLTWHHHLGLSSYTQTFSHLKCK